MNEALQPSIQVSHLHTFFLFPFAINTDRVRAEHRQERKGAQHWLDAFQQWLLTCSTAHSTETQRLLGRWQRAPYREFSMDSRAYEDMVFFHPFVRHVFFDAEVSGQKEPSLSLLRCYRIPLQDREVYLNAKGRHDLRRVQVTDLKLFIFANGIGILSIGVEARNIPVETALWINEMLRKVYPSSGRQRREGRAPGSVYMSVVRDGKEEILAEEKFERGEMVDFEPPLSLLIRRLLYFLNYDEHEYEQVLDERMIVYTYADLDQESLPKGFVGSEKYEMLVSRFLYVDRYGPSYRYDPEFILDSMDRQLYRRWVHEGTYYGATSYSNISVTVGSGDRGGHSLSEGFLIHRMFRTRYYLMAIIALFYRATLLMFNERSALISRDLYADQLRHEWTFNNIEKAQNLRGEFRHFTNYWFFQEVSNKDEESEHFDLQCREYRLDEMIGEISEELSAMSAAIGDFYQARNTFAVNRLAMLSLIFGAGAVFTGYFGMNFGRSFGSLFFDPQHPNTWVHTVSIVLVTLFTIGAFAFGFYLIAANWSDYGKILRPKSGDGRKDGLSKR
jgi:hypothetical protein